MDFKEYCRQQLTFYTDILARNVTLLDRRDQPLHSIDLSYDTLISQHQEITLRREESQTALSHKLQSMTPRQAGSTIPLSQKGEVEDLRRGSKIESAYQYEVLDSPREQGGSSNNQSQSRNQTNTNNESYMDSEDSETKFGGEDHDSEGSKVTGLNMQDTVSQSSQPHNNLDIQATSPSPLEGEVGGEGDFGKITDLNKAQMITLKKKQLEDGDFESFLASLKKNETFSGSINLAGHNITDQSIIKISQILDQKTPKISEICLEGNTRIGTEGIKVIGDLIKDSTTLVVVNLGGIQSQLPGVCRLIESLASNNSIKEFSLGVIDSQGLSYLGNFLETFGSLCYLTIQEDPQSPWTDEAKNNFLEDLGRARACPLLSINIPSKKYEQLEEFVASLSLILEERRRLFLLSEETEQASEALEIETSEVEQMEITEVLNSFSVKKYIDNVFNNKLEESLLFIQQHQANIQRTNKKKEVEGQKGDKVWEQSDLFTAEGCCYALASILLEKKDQLLNNRFKRRMELEIVEWKSVGTWMYNFRDEMCSICQQPFESPCPDCMVPGDDCIPINGKCSHIFHLHCIQNWIQSRQQKNNGDNPQEKPELCPNCKQVWDVEIAGQHQSQ